MGELASIDITPLFSWKSNRYFTNCDQHSLEMTLQPEERENRNSITYENIQEEIATTFKRKTDFYYGNNCRAYPKANKFKSTIFIASRRRNIENFGMQGTLIAKISGKYNISDKSKKLHIETKLIH